MKKNLLFIMAVAAVFAGCSNGNVFDEKEGGTNNPSEPIDNSEVEVVFGKATTIGVEQSKTRAALGETWNGERIAIWGVDRSETAQWNSVASHLFKQTDAVTATVAAGGAVTFDNGPYYYPMSSSINYSFYSCFPVSNNTTASQRAISCAYPIDGKTDIMWGEAVCVDGESVDGTSYSGFNALYFRKVVGAVTPDLKFKHCLTRLNFVVQKGIDGGKTVPVAVRDIKVLNVPTAAQLTVVGNGAGVLTETGATGTLSLFQGDTAFDTPVVPKTGTDTTLGTVLLMPSTTKSYLLSVTLEALDEDGNLTGKTETGTVTITAKEDFAANTQYKVTLTVYGLQIVDIKATLGKWLDGDDITQEVN